MNTKPTNHADIEGLVEDASLQFFNTFGVEARAKYLIQITEIEEFRQAVEFARDNFLECLVIGEGSNLLFVHDYPGLVIVMKLQGIAREGSLLRVAAGENWHQLVEWTLSHGLYGLENLALIPGTVGAAPIQNIGAYGCEVERFVERVIVYDTQIAKEVTFNHDDCDFSYRDSVFKRAPRGRYVILEVELRLNSEEQLLLDYEPLKAVVSKLDRVTARDVFDAVCRIRRKKLPDPKLFGNAGSFFKNPIVSAQKLEALKAQGFDVPSYATDDAELFKLPAAWLLEAAGWKGRVRGQAAVHESHALVLINLGKASGEDVLLLAQEMSNSVLQRFGIALQPEVQII